MIRAIRAAGGGRALHAYLISGPAGSGKSLAAAELARALVCTAPEAARPCGRCLACRKAIHGNHPDIRVTETAGRESFLVSQARELREDAARLPNEGRHKVFLLPDAAAMNEAAANALLKLLEEPPPYAVLVLEAENPSLLPATVRSRCVELRMRPVERDEGLPVLKGWFPDRTEEELAGALARSGGILGAARSALAAGETPHETAAAAWEALCGRDEFSLLAALCRLERRPREELRGELAELARIAGETAAGRRESPLEPSQAFAAAAAAREICADSAVYISAGNLLAGAAARLWTAAWGDET